MAATQHLTPAVVNIKILLKSRSLKSNQTKIKTENCKPGFIESVHETMKVEHLSRPLAPATVELVLNTKWIGIIDPEGPEENKETENNRKDIKG